MRLRLTLEYDGARFPRLATNVPQMVRDALRWVYESWERLAVAGRRTPRARVAAGRDRAWREARPSSEPPWH